MANVFGALNRFISRLDSDNNATQQRAGTSFGFQVLRNNSTSIALEPWFDFVIGINGRTIDNPEPDLLLTEIRNSAGTAISLGIYSAKGQQIREIYATVPADGTLLGLSLQWSPLTLALDVWHILDVMPNSPADVAGLLPYSDYVIGSPERVLRGEAALGELIEGYMNSALRLWVYNNEYNVTRMITITPAKNWGGDGALGCVLGYGALHRVPAPLTEPLQGPGETLFDGDEKAGAEESVADASAPTEFLIPANMAVSSPVATPGPPPGGKPRKARAHHNTGATAGLDDYFAEGEAQSREGEHAPATNASSAPPPPPKAAKS